MKRAHRRWQRWAWMLLAPTLALLLGLSWWGRSAPLPEHDLPQPLANTPAGGR